jgi:hypothetical protein
MLGTDLFALAAVDAVVGSLLIRHRLRVSLLDAFLLLWLAAFRCVLV